MCVRERDKGSGKRKTREQRYSLGFGSYIIYSVSWRGLADAWFNIHMHFTVLLMNMMLPWRQRMLARTIAQETKDTDVGLELREMSSKAHETCLTSHVCRIGNTKKCTTCWSFISWWRVNLALEPLVLHESHSRRRVDEWESGRAGMQNERDRVREEGEFSTWFSVYGTGWHICDEKEPNTPRNCWEMTEFGSSQGQFKYFGRLSVRPAGNRSWHHS